MSKSILHKYRSTVADGTDATLVRASNWNDDHDFWFGYRQVTTGPDTLTDSDNLTYVAYFVAAYGVAVHVPQPTTGPPATFAAGWNCRISVTGAGSITIICDGAATINGSSAQFTLYTNDTLELVGTGTNDYRGIIRRAPVAGRFGGILALQDATHLKFTPFEGAAIVLNGIVRPIPLTGIVGLASTGVFVGGVSGNNLATNTTYFVYVFDNNGILTADFRTTGHQTSGTAGNEGTEILSGDDTRSLIGMVRTDGSTHFIDAADVRWVRSWFGRERGVTLFAAIDSGVSSVNSGNYQPLGHSILWLSWANEGLDVFESGFGYCNGGPNTNSALIYLDATPAPAYGTQAGTYYAYYYDTQTNGCVQIYAEGYHYAQFFGWFNLTGYTGTWYSGMSGMLG